ncbi:MAG: hypothetical protein ACI96P_001647 [Candidatus Azotimanducaceae bacterium]|jgi:uncharacterized protein YjfI (DUF2170 family)
MPCWWCYHRQHIGYRPKEACINTQELAMRLLEIGSFEGYQFDCQPIPSDVGVLQVTVGDYEEIPVFVSVTDSQILCITHLFSESEVNPKFRARMLEEMLELNIPMPLSSFSKIGERYVVFGALSVNSSMDDICHELITVTENAVEALLAMEEFVRQDV